MAEMKHPTNMKNENEEVRVIKKYQNRKLYDTKDSCYITLDEIAVLIRKGEEIRVIDNKTKGDVTSIIFTQILVEQEKAEKSGLPVMMLRDLIRRGKGSLPDFIQRYVLMGFENNQERQNEAERYIDHLVQSGDLTKNEGKTLLREVLDSQEIVNQDVDQYIGTRAVHTLREMTKLSEIETNIKALGNKLESIENKVTDFENR